MELENIIQKEGEKNQQVLVDIPVFVEKNTETEKVPSKKIPWRWLVYLGIGPVVLLIIIVMLRGTGEAPDLEITMPTKTSTNKNQVVTLNNSQSTESGVIGGGIYKNEKEGFQITPPSGWQLDETGKTGAIVIFLNPTTKTIGNINYATILTVEKRNVEESSLSDQIKSIKDKTSKDFPDFVFENDSLFYLKGQPYYLIGGNYVVGGVDMRRRSLITVNKGYGYAATASGPMVTWPDNESVISDAQFSFKLL